MKMIHLFKYALKNLNRNRKRSLLTMLGIIIGIASVISIVALGEAFKEETIQKFSAEGSGENDIKVVFQREDEMNHSEEDFLDEDLYTSDQLDALAAIENIEKATFNYDMNMFDDFVAVDLRGKQRDASLDRVEETASEEIIAGRNFTQEEYRNGQKVILINEEMLQDQSPKDLIGSVAVIDHLHYEVVGIFKDLLETEKMIIPEKTHQRYMNFNKEIQGFNLVLKDGEMYDETIEEIEMTLAKLKSSDLAGNYEVEDDEILLDLLGNILSTITTFISLVASIALLIAGIGLMNMIYTSVYEREKEIGIKKALGAKKIDIQREFVIEGILLTLFGGLLGYILGLIIANIISVFFNFTVYPSVFTVALSVVICILIGFLSSLVPAKKGANTNTVDLLM